MKKIISLVMVVMMMAIFTCTSTYASCVSEHTFQNVKCGDNISCTLENGILTISGNGEMYDYTDTIKPWDWDNICDDMACDFVYDVVIENGVTRIGNSAFENCTQIQKIVIPESVVSIGDNAFLLCDRLSEIQVSENNSEYCSVEGVLFSKDKKTLLRYPPLKDGTEYIVPDGVTNIADKAFHYSKLESVIIPDGVVSIGNESFTGNRSLTSIQIPSSVQTIHDMAFVWCEELTVYGEEGSVAHQYALNTTVQQYALDNEVPFRNVTEINNVQNKNNSISVQLDGVDLVFDQPPIIENGRTLVPFRAIFEALGTIVGWNDTTKTVRAENANTIIELTIGSNIMRVGGTDKILDVPAKIVNNRTMVPARAVAEALGAKVDWDASLNRVIISTK